MDKLIASLANEVCNHKDGFTAGLDSLESRYTAEIAARVLRYILDNNMKPVAK